MSHIPGLLLFGPALLALLLAGCGEGAKEGPAGSGTGDPKLARDQEATRQVEERFAAVSGKVKDLPAANKTQEAYKMLLENSLRACKVEMTRKDRLQATLPPNAMERISQTLDEVEQKIADYPK